MSTRESRSGGLPALVFQYRPAPLALVTLKKYYPKSPPKLERSLRKPNMTQLLSPLETLVLEAFKQKGGHFEREPDGIVYAVRGDQRLAVADRMVALLLFGDSTYCPHAELKIILGALRKGSKI